MSRSSKSRSPTGVAAPCALSSQSQLHADALLEVRDARLLELNWPACVGGLREPFSSWDEDLGDGDVAIDRRLDRWRNRRERFKDRVLLVGQVPAKPFGKWKWVADIRLARACEAPLCEE